MLIQERQVQSQHLLLRADGLFQGMCRVCDEDENKVQLQVMKTKLNDKT